MRHRSLIALLALAWSQAAAADDAWKVGEPIVTYWAGPGFPGGGPLDDDAAARIAAGGWNLAWCGEKELDAARRHGLRGLLTDPLLSPGSLEDPGRREALGALVDRVKGHPALYAYHLADEPGAAAFPALGGLVGFLRGRDPARLAYVNLLPVYASNRQLGVEGDPVPAYAEHLRRFAEVVRPGLLSYDHYQFRRDGDGGQYFLNLSMVRGRALASGVPFLNVVQASSWVPGAAASPASPRVPGPDELRYLVYTTLAYGAQGISHYVYRYPGHEGGMAGGDGAPTPLGVAAAALNREFAAVAGELQPLRSLGVYHAGSQPAGAVPPPAGMAIALDRPPPAEEPGPGGRVRGLLLGSFGPPAGATHLLVVNLDYRSGRGVTLKGAGPLQVFDAGARRWAAAGDRAEFTLPGGGGKLVRLRP